MISAKPTPVALAERAGTLFAQYQAGDEPRMGELITLLTPILWHTVRAQNLDSASAEDVLQTTWLALVRSADSISDPRAILQWLIVSARREAWRVVKVQRRVDPQDIEADTVVAPLEHSPEATVLRNAVSGQLWEHVALLPERCRALLRVIAFAERPDYAAVAAALDMPVGSIGPTRGRCLAKLRAQLAADETWEI